MTNNTKKYKVAVILGYHNGAKYIKEQVDSILNQSYKNIDIYIFDDCSTDPFNLNDLNLDLEGLKRTHVFYRDENLGFAKNFLNALSHFNDHKYDYFAFSDQDDIWESDKIMNAIKSILFYDKNCPILYCARTTAINESNDMVLGVSPEFKGPPSFSNALVQNIGGGNTMVFNDHAYDLISNSNKNFDLVSHDWWSYQVVSGAGGVVHFDSVPCLKYRQHPGNIIGSNLGLRARVHRIHRLLAGDFYNWNSKNLIALKDNWSMLTVENQKKVNYFYEARKSAFPLNLILAKKAGIYRQTFLGNIALVIGLILHKI